MSWSRPAPRQSPQGRNRELRGEAAAAFQLFDWRRLGQTRGPQVLHNSILSSQPLAPPRQFFFPSCWAPLGTPKPQLLQLSVHSLPQQPKLASGLRDHLSALLDSSGSLAHFGPSNPLPPQRHPAVTVASSPRQMPPVRCQMLPLHRRQNPQNACARMTHTYRHNTTAHP